MLCPYIKGVRALMNLIPDKPPLVATDLESVLTPEIWIAIAEKTGIAELRLTTRDVADYDALMTRRIDAVNSRGLLLRDLVRIVDGMQPLPGAVEFLGMVRSRCPLVVLSDTYYELASPLIAKLGCPAVLCNTLVTDATGKVTGYRLRQADGKRRAVEAFESLGYRVVAIGDSFNDVAMLRAANAPILVAPPDATAGYIERVRVVADLNELTAAVSAILR